MESFDPVCTKHKKAYDSCFNAWFRDRFLKGHSDHDAVCGELFNTYQQCLTVCSELTIIIILAYTYFYYNQRALQSKNLKNMELNEDLLGTDKEKKPP